jgi:hypothetical protein
MDKELETHPLTRIAGAGDDQIKDTARSAVRRDMRFHHLGALQGQQPSPYLSSSAGLRSDVKERQQDIAGTGSL